jgi:NADH-quinone oxidoreductase subunit I
MNILRKTAQGLRGLLSGMGLTFGYFARPSTVITQQYPENRATLKLPERTASRIDLIKDEATGKYKCTACGLCARACPNNSIRVDRIKDPETNKLKLTAFVYHLERCTMCGLCVDACKFDALEMTTPFENATYDPDRLTLILNAGGRPARPEELVEPPPAPKPAGAPTA